MREGLDVGNVLGRVFDMYRDQFGLLVPAALVVFIPIAVINGLILNSGLVFAGLITAGIALVGTGDLISRTLIAPLSALAAAVIYFELKRLHEEAVPGQEAATALAQPVAPQPAAPQPASPQQEPPTPPPAQP